MRRRADRPCRARAPPAAPRERVDNRLSVDIRLRPDEHVAEHLGAGARRSRTTAGPKPCPRPGLAGRLRGRRRPPPGRPLVPANDARMGLESGRSRAAVRCQPSSGREVAAVWPAGRAGNGPFRPCRRHRPAPALPEAGSDTRSSAAARSGPGRTVPDGPLDTRRHRPVAGHLPRNVRVRARVHVARSCRPRWNSCGNGFPTATSGGG